MPPENPPISRGASGRFLPGNNGNGGGRPKGLAALVRQETRDGAELVAFFLAVLRNPKQPTALRVVAGQWLADRGFGKAVTVLEADITLDAQVSAVDPVRERIREVLTRADADRVARRLLG